MLLLVVGGVMNASAAAVRRGIQVEIGGNLNSWENEWTYPILHMWYNNGSNDVNVTGDFGSTHLTWYKDADGKKYWYYSFTLDETVLSNYTFNIIIRANNGNESGSGQIRWENITFDCDKKIVITDDGNGSAVYTTSDVTYYLIDVSNNILSTLSNNSAVYTGTFNSNGHTETQAYLAPEYARDNGIKWALVYRPTADNNGDYWITGDFKVFNASLYENSSSTGAFDFRTSSLYELSFDLTTVPSFTITPYVEFTMGDAGYATYSKGEKFTVEGATVYTASANNKSTVHLDEQDANTVYPAATGSGSADGFILKANSGSTVTIHAVAADAATTVSGANLLNGSGNSSRNVTATDYTYVFSWDDSDPSSVGFYKAESGEGTLEPHKAYLDVTSAGAREFLSFDFGDETTGISSISKTNDNNVIYNLQGIRQNQLQKGLNIVNGKKVMVI